MRPYPECASCILNRAVYEANIVAPERAMTVVKEVLKILCERFSRDRISIKLWTEVHAKINEILGTDDPYRELKRESNDIALKLFPRAMEYYERSDDKFRMAELIAITGNILDFGVSIKSPEDFERRFEELIKEGIGHDETDKLKKYLKGHVVYITDNCGEIVFDKILIREMRKYVDRITILVRGKPIISDATLEDAIYMGLDKEVDEIKTTGIFAVGVDIDMVPGDIKYLLKNADLIIAKGMGNYESLSESGLKPIAYLLRTKCLPVARDMNLPKDINVVRVYE